MVDDAEDDWAFPHTFDFIHGRALVTCFQDPAAVIAKAHAALCPGGYLELQDVVFPTRGIDGTYDGCASERLARALLQAANRLGKDFTHSRRYKKYLEAAGFVDVQERHFQWPIGPWPKGERLKLMGMLFRQELVQGLEGMTMALLTRGLGMEPGSVKEWVEEARGNLMDSAIHAYMPGYACLCLFARGNTDLL